MNPQEQPTNQPNNGLSLPPVQQSQTQQPPAATTSDPVTPSPGATPLQPVAPQVPVSPQTPTSPAQTPTATDSDSDVPLIADDADLIEKEWVEKAKSLVEQTKDDPYKQNKEINKFKATYIKKRYNKDVQLSKD